MGGRVVVELRGIGEPADRLVAARERELRSGDRRIERERLLEVYLGLRVIVEALVVDQRELEVERTAIAWSRGGRDLAVEQRRRERPLAAHHGGGPQLS